MAWSLGRVGRGPALRRAGRIAAGLALLLGGAGSARAYQCVVDLKDGYGRITPAVANRRVVFQGFLGAGGETDPKLFEVTGTTDADGYAALQGLPADPQLLATALRCKVEARGARTEKLVKATPPNPFPRNTSIVSSPILAPKPDDRIQGIHGLKGLPIGCQDAPEADASAALYRSADGAYDKVFVIAEPNNPPEHEVGYRDHAMLWMEFEPLLRRLFEEDFDVWLVHTPCTGQNLHEQAAELAQAVVRIAAYDGGSAAGRIALGGYSLGGPIVRIATARWEASEGQGGWTAAEKAELGLTDPLPVSLIVFGDAPLRGAQVNLDLQRFLWEEGRQKTVNLNSCSVQQLVRESWRPDMGTAATCGTVDCNHRAFFETGEEVAFPRLGTCDRALGVPNPYRCICDAGPAVETINGDGFAHGPRKIAFTDGKCGEPNRCYGGERDRTRFGEDLCADRAARPWTPASGDEWLWLEIHGCPFGFGDKHFHLDSNDLVPGSRQSTVFDGRVEDVPGETVLHSIPIPGVNFIAWGLNSIGLLCYAAEFHQFASGTFIPASSALATDQCNTNGPFDDTRQNDYSGAHAKPSPAVVDWLFAELNAATAGTGDPGDPGVPPAAPTQVTAFPLPSEETRIRVTWRDNSGNEDGFHVLRLKGGDTNYHIVGTVAADETEWIDEEAFPPPGGPGSSTTAYYFYQVRAFNDAGSAISTQRGEARMFNVPPARPYPATPKACIEELRPRFHWTLGQYASSYAFYLVNSDTGESWKAYPVKAEWKPPFNLKPGTAYRFKVKGRNNVDDGEWSDYQYFMPFCEPIEQPVVIGPVGCVDSVTPTLSWEAVPTARSYQLKVSPADPVANPICYPDVVPTSFTIPAVAPPSDPLCHLVPGREYRFQVKANNGAVDGAWSRILYFTPNCVAGTAPGTPSPVGPFGRVETGSPTFAWDPAPRAERYRLRVFVRGANTEVFSQVFEASGADGICDPRGCAATPNLRLAPGEYGWNAWGRNAVGEGPISPNSFFTVPADLPEVAVGDASPVRELLGHAVAARFVVFLSRPPAASVTVRYQTADGSAHAPSDYVATSGTLVLAPGQMSAEVAVPIVDDGVFEREEGFALQLTSASLAVTDGEGRVTLISDDLAPRLTAGAVSVVEGDGGKVSVQIPVTLEGETELPAAVDVVAAACSATPGSDFGAAEPKRIDFPPGVHSGLVTVPVNGDTLYEPDETFLLALSDPEGATVESGGQGTILDDDPQRPGGARPLPPRADWSGDGGSDLLWRNASSGALTIWQQRGLVRTSGFALSSPSFPDAGWSLVAAADFDRNGTTDLVWRNATSGRLSFWWMTGASHTGGVAIDGKAEADWQVAASADFNRDGSPDLLWRNDLSGELSIWLMSGASLLLEVSPVPAAPADADWQAVAAADFDNDGWADLLFRHRQSGALVAWYLQNLTRISGAPLAAGTPPQPGLDLLGVWDADLDGWNDLIWRERSTGRLSAWFLRSGATVCTARFVPDQAVDGNWEALPLR